MQYRFLAVGTLMFLVLAMVAKPALADTPFQSRMIERTPQEALTGEQLAAFLETHKGPILDVRAEGDCDPAVTLPQTTHRLAVSLGPNDPRSKSMTIAPADFVSTLRNNRTFVQVNRNQTPILVVCCGGKRSAAAAALLARQGFNVVTVDGGVNQPYLIGKVVGKP